MRNEMRKVEIKEINESNPYLPVTGSVSSFVFSCPRSQFSEAKCHATTTELLGKEQPVGMSADSGVGGIQCLKVQVLNHSCIKLKDEGNIF